MFIRIQNIRILLRNHLIEKSAYLFITIVCRGGGRTTLAEIIDELLENNYIPSFCTACYRLGRTGEHFMEFSVPGFIKRYCTPNAILTLSEYIVDYASEEVAAKGWKVIENNMVNVDEKFRDEVLKRIERIKAGERDLYF